MRDHEIDVLVSRLKAVENEYPHGGIKIERSWRPATLPWSCDIYCGAGGYGTGESMLDAIEDALFDLERAP